MKFLSPKILLIILPLLAGAMGFVLSWRMHACGDVIATRGTGPYCVEESLSGEEFQGGITDSRNASVKRYTNNFHGIEFTYQDPAGEVAIDHEHKNSILLANQAYYGRGDRRSAQYILIYLFDPGQWSPTWEQDFGSLENFVKAEPVNAGFYGEITQSDAFTNTFGLEVLRFRYRIQSSGENTTGYLIKRPHTNHRYFAIIGAGNILTEAVSSFRIR